MYNRDDHTWVSDCKDQELLRWCREPANAERPEAKFLRASELLSQHRRGSEAAEAVLLMEQAAKEEYPPAVFAMGQMFQWGWAVHRDTKRAAELYRRAAALGDKNAEKALAEVRHRRIMTAAAAIAAAAACIALTLAAWRFLPELGKRHVILVHDDTVLAQTSTLEEFSAELQQLIAANDDELVISGQVSTNRILLRFDGGRLDLSDYLAKRVIAREDDLVVVQFSGEEEARRCLEELARTPGIVFAEMDEYVLAQDGLLTLQIAGILNPQSDCDSWGVADMGLDRLSEYVAEQYPDRDLIVAVVDGGAVAGSKFAHRFLPGCNIVTGGDIVPDEHGTHVAGTIADGTRGTNIRIMSIDIFNGEDSCSNSAVALGVEYAVKAGAQVINMSLGSASHSALKESAVTEALEAGVVVVKSAGNNGADTATSCPAELSEPIVVGAYDAEHNIAGFSNYGDSVDVCAPGVDILSQYYLDDKTLISLDGTSMAAPHVSALAALVRMIYPDATPAQVELYITDYCRNTNPEMYDTGLYGAGAPDAAAFIEVTP